MAVFLPIVPNWQNGVRDTYEFRTSIFTSRNGNEQRRAERIQPRRTLDVAIMPAKGQLRHFADAMTEARDGKVLVGDFSADAAVLTQTALIGATILHVDHIPTWLSSGDVALRTGRRSKRVTVDFVSGNQVVLTTGLTEAAGSGAELMPLIPATVARSTTFSMHTTQHGTAPLSLSVEPGFITRVADPLPVDPEGDTYQGFGPAAIFYGRYVLLRKPNYLQRPQVSFNKAFETVDYDRGVTKTFTPVPLTSRTLTATYYASTRNEALSILDIFVRAKGRAAEIYVPTWGSDLPPVKSVFDSSIVFEGTDLHRIYANDEGHKAILLRLADDNLVPFEIQEMTLDGGDTEVKFDRPIGLAPSDIAYASWMFVARFAQDALTINWLTNGKANISLSFVTLVNLAVEQSFGPNWILTTGYWRDRGQWEDTAVWQD